jgi:plasmid maintenance system antidote protein VapI
VQVSIRSSRWQHKVWPNKAPYRIAARLRFWLNLKVYGEAAHGALGALSAILNGRAGISPEMVVRLSIAFGTSAESWLNQQTQYDLWHAKRRRKELRVRRLAA